MMPILLLSVGTMPIRAQTTVEPQVMQRIYDEVKQRPLYVVRREPRQP